MEDENCYIVNNKGEVLAVMSPELTVSLLKQMYGPDETDKVVPEVANDRTEMVNGLYESLMSLQLHLTEKGKLILKARDAACGDGPMLTREEVGQLLDVVMDYMIKEQNEKPDEGEVVTQN